MTTHTARRFVMMLAAIAPAALTAQPARAAAAIGVALSPQTEGGFETYAVYVGADPAVAAVVLCANVAVKDCAATAGAAKASFLSNNAGQKIFRTDAPVALANGAKWAVVALDARGAAVSSQIVRFDLSEIEAFTKQKTEEIADQNPVAYGFNYQFLIMNEVPGATYLAQVKGGTDGMTNAQVRASAAALDRALAD